MEEQTIIEKLKNAIERATKNVIMVNSDASFRPASTETGEIVEHGDNEAPEALLTAMIYHETINEGIPMSDILMEERTPKSKGKRSDFYIDNIISNGKANALYIEVKTFKTYNVKNKEDEIRNKFKKVLTGKGEIKRNTIYYDIDKLNKAVNDSKENLTKTMMIIADQSNWIKDVCPAEIMMDELKHLLKKESFSGDILFAIADNFKAVIKSAGEIKGMKHDV
jgi:hypothetical protein